MSIDDKRKDKNPFGRSISASPGLPALAIQKSLHRRLHRVLSTRIGSPNDKVHLSFSDLIADIGGYLGLFLGLSVFGLVELLEKAIKESKPVVERAATIRSLNKIVNQS